MKEHFALRRDLRRAVGASRSWPRHRAARPGDEVAIVGAGIGGLTLALALHRAGIACRVYEAAAEIRPLGVGINVLPHASAALAVARRPRRRSSASPSSRARRRSSTASASTSTASRPDAGPATTRRSCRSTAPTCRRSCSTPCRERIGADRVVTGHACVAVDGVDDARVRLRFRDPAGTPIGDAMAAVAVGCDGIHSALRKQLYPDEGPPRWSGVNMWRGVVAACAVPERRDHGPRRLALGRQDGDLSDQERDRRCRSPARQLGRRARVRGAGAARLERTRPARRLLPRLRRLALRLARRRRPHPLDRQGARLSDGRPGPVAALELRPRHAARRRGASDGPARLERRRRRRSSTPSASPTQLAARGVGADALAEYDRIRNAATAKIVLANRSTPPDTILREVHERSGDKPFARIEDVVSREELERIADAYKQVAGLKPVADEPRRRP